MKFTFALAILVALGTASAAAAGDREETVKFEPGASTASRTGTIHRYNIVRYYLDARAGQTLLIDFKKNKSTCYFHVQAPPDFHALDDDLPESRKFRAKLDRSGTYRAVVHLMRVSARRGRSCTFTINFDLKP